MNDDKTTVPGPTFTEQAEAVEAAEQVARQAVQWNRDRAVFDRANALAAAALTLRALARRADEKRSAADAA